MPSPGWNPSAVDRRWGPELSGPPGPSPAAASTAAASLRGAAPEPRVPGVPAPGRGQQLRNATIERLGRGVWAGAGESEQRVADLDLRVHAPVPEVVIVWVSGTVDTRTTPLLVARGGQQLHRAPHVVVDLGEVTVRDPRGLAVLLTVHQTATASGTEIHIAGAEHDVARRALRTTGLDQLLTLDPTADAVIADFRAEPGRSAVLAAADPPRRRWIGRPVTAAGLATEDITGGAAVQPYTRNRVVEVRHEHRHRR
jgi:anti-anti-sigma factor